jgi:hypothetical protein
MADIKVLYINADGRRTEHSEANDSIKMSSLKTATYELTDAKLGKLVDGTDAADEHIHDARYYQESEHVSTSAGAGDASKPIILDAGGKLDESLLDIDAIEALLHHGDLQGLGDDDHTIYSLATGTRDYTGIVKYDVHPTFTTDTQIVDKKYVDDILTTSEWFYKSALDYVVDNTAVPPTEVSGDVYVLSHDGGAPHANYDGASAGDIVEFDGSVWVATTPTTGTRIGVDDEPNVAFYLWGGSSWTAKYEESTTASTGLTKVGFDIRIDSSAGGDGLGFAAGVLSVNVDDSTIETNADTLRVKADGINDTHIDFGTGANQVSAVDIPIADAGGYFATDEVEFALQQLAADITDRGVTYTVGAGGVTKGDALYVSSNDTVLPFATITADEEVVGLALTTEAAAGSVKVLANDTIVTGVLAGAVAGTEYYWNGTTFVTSISGSANQNIWKVGVAKNATDLHVQIEHVKKNAA